MAKNLNRSNFKDLVIKEEYYKAKELLLKNNINNVDYKGRSVLHEVAISKKPTIEMIKFLVENGVGNINQKDSFGKSPLYYFLIKKHYDIAEFMIKELGAEVYKKDFADRPQQANLDNELLNFSSVVKWCERLSSKLLDEKNNIRISEGELLNELTSEPSIGTYFSRCPTELVSLMCKMNEKKINAEFYHEDDSIPYHGYSDSNVLVTGYTTNCLYTATIDM